MKTGHISAALFDRYIAGEAEATETWWAVEVHLESCAACRDRLAETVTSRSPATAALLERVREPLFAEVARTPPMPPRRRRSRWARRWVAPALLPRLAMTALVVVAAVALDLADGADAGRYPSLVLLLAPVAPLLGVAAAWSRGLDPAHEVVVSSARAGLDLVLRRTVGVLAVVIPALSGAGWLVGASPARWLLPCLGCTVGALALGEVVGLHRAASGLALAWALAVVGPSLVLARPPVLLAPAGLPAWAVVTAAVAVLLVARRHTYTELPSGR
jgi:hypothetical protein